MAADTKTNEESKTTSELKTAATNDKETNEKSQTTSKTIIPTNEKKTSEENQTTSEIKTASGDTTTLNVARLLDLLEPVEMPTNVPQKNQPAQTEATFPLQMSPSLTAIQNYNTSTTLSLKNDILLSGPVSSDFKTSEFVWTEGLLKKDFYKALREAGQLEKNVPFEIFNSTHMDFAAPLMGVLYTIDLNNLELTVTTARKEVNEELLNYVLSVVYRHRPELRAANVQIPSHINLSPYLYLDVTKVGRTVIHELDAHTLSSENPLIVDITHDFTATDTDPEHFVAYWREDIGLNLHHRHWHEVYPNRGDVAIIKKDRRGELFYYMHQQMLARYNFERFSNGLNKTEPLDDFREPIKEAYYPKLDQDSRLQLWCPRQGGATLKSVRRNGQNFTIVDLERQRERIIDAIDKGFVVITDETKENCVMKKLEEEDAIDKLGNLIEAAPALSLNPEFYGNLHNFGHMIISYCHDPDNRFKENANVMGFVECAMRDPIFYRWHHFVDDLFQRYKGTLKPYTKEQREFNSVSIDKISVITKDDSDTNVLRTYWQRDLVDITEGIFKKDPSKDRPVKARFKHLQHKDFTYTIEVTNTSSTAVKGVVRIFMAPIKDESRTEMRFNRIRRFMIEMDKFVYELQPGANTIKRESTCSSVTIPFEQVFMSAKDAKEYSNNESKRIEYCGCGLPHYLLVGRGQKIGFPCYLFVTITDYEKDKVTESEMNAKYCGTSSISYCGLRDKKYPDKRAMGFPFDRNVKSAQATIRDFMTENQDPQKSSLTLTNTALVEIIVKYEDYTVDAST